MKARILGRTGALAGFEVGFEDRLTLGRDPSCEARVDLASVSSRHASIEWDDERSAFYLEDLGSRNGTWVDGVRVKGRERLGRLSVVTLAEEHDLLFQNLSECEERARAADLTPTEVPLSRGGGATEPRPAAGGGAAPEPAPKPAAAPRAAPPAGDTIIEPAPPPPMPGPNAPALPEPGAGVRVSLEVEGEAGPRVVPLEPGENVVGRVPGAQIQLDSTTVSRRHAVLTVRGENVRIRDEGSRNKTLLEGDPLEAGVERELRAGASIHFGTVAARLRIDH